MKIVIDIPDEEYRWIKKSDETVFANVASKECMLHAIKNGTPLPKGHGRLIDADAFIDFLKNISKTQRYNEFIIDKKLTGLTVDDVFNAVCESLQNEGLAENDSPTILEADKESENDDT